MTNQPIEPTETKHLAYLDGWRGIAIILVLLSHFGEFRQFGRSGVDFFFVLSGLLMSQILFVDKMPLRKFYQRRIARIFPVFYLYLLVVGGVFYLYLPMLNTSDLTYSSLFLRTYFPGESIWINGENINTNTTFPIGHLWSLHVEEHCYIFLSIISLLALKYNEKLARHVVTVAALTTIALFAYYKLYPPQSQSPIFLRSETAGFAILISSSIFLWLRHLRLTVPSWLPVISALAGLIIGASFQYGPFKFVVSPLLLAISVNTLNFAPAFFLRMLSNRILVWFGLCSFSIYIWQQPFYFMTLRNYWDYSYLTALIMALIVGGTSKNLIAI